MESKYYCYLCNYQAKRSCDFKRHLKTKKHEKKSKDEGVKNTKSVLFPPKSTKIHQAPPKSTKKSKQVKELKCAFCDKIFGRSDSLKRHENSRCKGKIVIENQNKHIEELKKQVELLMDKVSNTQNINNTITNNITQNIQLNNYGAEDLSHISNNIKTDLLKIPYLMIPKLIEIVHFNQDKPENKNIMIVNKKDKFIKIFKNGKWEYKDRNETLNDLIDGKYYILDDHYNENATNSMSQSQQLNYEKFRDAFDERNKNISSKIKKQCEITLLNNMDNN